MFTREALQQRSKDELIEIILSLSARLTALEAEVRELKRAKAPFSKGVRKASPKPPGRRAGQGHFTRRAVPEIGPEDKVIELDAPLPADERDCPRCDVPLQTSNEVVTIEDMPQRPSRVITRITVEVGVCPLCGHRARGEHPSLGPHQCGANAHQVGPGVLSQALALHYQSGLPLRRVPQVIKQTTGIVLTQSALTQTAGKLSEPGAVMHTHYQSLRKTVAASEVVNTDDTGWRVSATLAFLMGFFTADTAYYQIRSRHRHQEVLEVLGEGFAGKLGTDRGKSYEATALRGLAMSRDCGMPESPAQKPQRSGSWKDGPSQELQHAAQSHAARRPGSVAGLPARRDGVGKLSTRRPGDQREAHPPTARANVNRRGQPTLARWHRLPA